MDLAEVLLEHKIIYKSKGCYIRVPKYKDKLSVLLEDPNIAILYNNYIAQYRFEEEAWHCLLKGDNPNNHLCEVCGRPSKFNATATTVGYSRFCSKECRNKSRGNNRAKTCLDKYGYESAMQSKVIQDKSRQTCISRYGVENPNQSDGIKAKKRQTCIDKYGVECSLLSSQAQLKTQQTLMSNYGVSNPLKSEVVKDKIRATNLKRYGVPSYSQTEEYKHKYISTSNAHYSTNNPRQSVLVSNLIRDTNKARYGAEYYTQTEEFKERYRNTCIGKYGVPTTLLVPEVKDKITTVIKSKYGVDNVSQSPLIKEKKRQTCISRYGVDSYTKTEEFARQRSKRWVVEGQTYDSKSEIYYAYYLKYNNIPYERQVPLSYRDASGYNHVYFVDFLILDTQELVELKGKHLIDEGTGELKNPYISKLTEAQRQALKERDEAKSKCMRDHRVTIITDYVRYEKLFKEYYPNLKISPI